MPKTEASWHQIADKRAMEILKLREELEALKSYTLPCDVHLPPNTTITKGCRLSTLLEELKLRKEKQPLLT